MFPALTELKTNNYFIRKSSVRAGLRSTGKFDANLRPAVDCDRVKRASELIIVIKTTPSLNFLLLSNDPYLVGDVINPF